MSRSVKKNPGFTNREKSITKSRTKTQAARKVRHTDEIGDNGSYKKHFETWRIADYSYRDSFRNGVKKKVPYKSRRK
jgi:hypothetical protein